MSEALYGAPDIAYLCDLVKAVKARRIVELGTHKGGTAIPLAQSLPDDGHLWAVDSWLDIASPRSDAGGGNDRYHTFLAAVEKSHLQKKITPIRATTQDAAYSWDHGQVDFIHIDANHHRIAVLKDIMYWLPHLRLKGMFAGHDWGHNFGAVSSTQQFGVAGAVLLLAEWGIITEPAISPSGNVWYSYRIGP